MRRHLTQQELDDYRRRTVRPADLLAINEHLASCDECYGKFSSKTSLTAAYDFARADLADAESEEIEHLDFDQVTAYVNDELGGIDREIAVAHLEFCSECHELCQDLRRFKSDLASGKVYAPASSPALKERIKRFRRPFAPSIKAAAWGAVAAVAILVVGFLMQRKIADLQSQVNQLQQQNNSLNGDLSTISDLRSQIEQLRGENQRLQELTQSLESKLRTSPKNSAIASPEQVAINDEDGRVTLDRQGELEGWRYLSASHRKAVSDALRTGRVRTPTELSALVGERKQIMGPIDQESFVPLSPVGIVVTATQPTFRWRPLSGASAYTVLIYHDNLSKVASSPSLTGTEWTPPPLGRGQTYSWQIRAIKDGREIISPPPSAAEARFRVLGQSRVNELERAKQLYSKSHLTLGVVYAQMGLLEEAAAEFQALLKTNPNSPLVEKLLRSVTSRQRQLENR